jgi:serine/threonine-protein kinase RsbT
VSEPVRLSIASQVDVERARRAARAAARGIGFGAEATEEIVLAVSELATNLMRYAVSGTITLSAINCASGGLRIESRDAGPGIADIALARREGFSTSGGLGSGLPAIGRLMDELTIESSPVGTLIVASKWRRP